MKESITRDKLEASFDTLILRYNQAQEVPTQETSHINTRQQKYALTDLLKTREMLEHDTTLVKRVTHQDYYFLPEGAHPSYLTECICLREEKDLDTPDSPIKTTLIYKSNPHTDSDSNTRTVKSVDIPEDLEGAFAVLELLESEFGEPFAQIYKERQVYIRNEASVYVDTNVIATDKDKLQHYLGNFIEITTDASNSSESAATLASDLQLGATIDLPYLDYVRLEKYVPNQQRSAERSTESNASTQMYFDWKTESFVEQIDPSKIKRLNTITEGRAEAILTSVAQLIDDYDANPENSHQGVQTPRLVHETYKPFKHYRAPLRYLNSTRTFRYGLDNGYRVVVSAVTTVDGRKGIILHFSGTHEEYDRWISRHK